jgi:hypothetical protein
MKPFLYEAKDLPVLLVIREQQTTLHIDGTETLNLDVPYDLM